MRTTTLTGTLAIGIISTVLPLRAQTAFDITADFSITNGNPNGVWSYGWMPTDFGTFNLFATNQNQWGDAGSLLYGWYGWAGDFSPHILLDKGSGIHPYVPAGWLTLHPGPDGEPAVLRWDAPSAGLALIQGHFLAGDSGTMLVAVRKAGAVLWQGIDSGDFDLVEAVLLGDSIDFAVYGGYSYGNTPLAATITLTASGIYFRETSYAVAENGKSVSVEVIRAGPDHFDEAVSVDYATVAGTASSGEDYVVASGTLDFAAGETSKWITVSILDDTLFEGKGETFIVRLSNATGGVNLGAHSETSVFIADNDQGTLYVSLESTNPVPPYGTWATAANAIQDAVDAAKAGDTVLVANGVYAVGGKTNEWGGVESRVTITNAIRLESVNGPLVTTIYAATTRDEYGSIVDSSRCVYLGSNAVLSGFTLTNGYALWGGGVFSEPSGVVTNCTLIGNLVKSGSFAMQGRGGGAHGGTLYNCTLTNNRADNRFETPSALGGGVYGATLYNCTLTGNSAGGYGASGGGASVSKLYSCTLDGNSASYGGGASASTLYNCTLTGNSAYRGAGTGGGTLHNCIVTGNSASYGGGASDSTLYNCTVTANSAIEAEGGWDGAAGGGAVACTVYNSIVYYNTTVFYSVGNHAEGNYAEGTTLNFSCTTPLPTNGIGNLTGPPLFMDMAGGDFRLREESPCIDAGTNLLGVSFTSWTGKYDPETGEPVMVVGRITDPTDILGNTRFIDGDFDGKVAWDIGAYEFSSFTPPRFSIAPQLTPDGWRLNITGAADQWVHLQRSSDLKNWEDVWSGWMGAEGAHQCNDGNPQGAMFYRAVVP